MRYLFIFLLLVFLGCQSKQNEHAEQRNIAEQPKKDLTQPQKQYDYTPLYGIYDHESTTNSFGAVLSIQQNGLDLYFSISVVQGNCKAETEGVIVMAEHTENFYIGFADIENCPLQFTFSPKENKIDIKEVTLCTIHGSTCSFEGVYEKRGVRR